MQFVDVLNESAVTYVRDVEALGWAWAGGQRDGWEAISPSGEIRCYDTYAEAQRWRMAEVREFFAFFTR